MEFKKATVFLNSEFDLPLEDPKIFERIKQQRLSTFIKSVRKYVFQRISNSELNNIFALIVYEGDIGKIYEKITKNDVSKSNDFDMAKFKQLRAYRHEAREDKK